jgi:transposase-like protein
MTKHKVYDAEFKVKVVLEILKGEKTMAQICREYDVADDLVCHWKQVFLERAPELFRVKQQHAEVQARIAEFQRLVGQQALELAASKKSRSGWPPASATADDRERARGGISGGAVVPSDRLGAKSRTITSQASQMTWTCVPRSRRLRWSSRAMATGA